MAGNLDLPADVTGEVELRKHDSDSENKEEERRKQEKKKGDKKSGQVKLESSRMTGLVKKNLPILLKIFVRH